jgi:hypothetical protein
MTDETDEDVLRPYFLRPYSEVYGFGRQITHPRMILSVAVYFVLLWLFQMWFDPISIFWLAVAVLLAIATLPWGIMECFRSVVDETDSELENPIEAEEHEERTSEPVGVPDDISGIENIPPVSEQTDNLDDLSDLAEDFDVSAEPDPKDDGD